MFSVLPWWNGNFHHFSLLLSFLMSKSSGKLKPHWWTQMFFYSMLLSPLSSCCKGPPASCCHCHYSSVPFLNCGDEQGTQQPGNCDGTISYRLTIQGDLSLMSDFFACKGNAFWKMNLGTNLAQLQYYNIFFMWHSDIVAEYHQEHTTLFVNTITCGVIDRMQWHYCRKYIYI